MSSQFINYNKNITMLINNNYKKYNHLKLKDENLKLILIELLKWIGKLRKVNTY